MLFSKILLCILPLFSSILAQTTDDFKWPSQYVRSGSSNLRVLVQGAGPTVVILPSYGRDGGDDYNLFTSSLATSGFLDLRPQPRGTLGSTGPMTNVTMADLASDVATVIDALGSGQAIIIGHAFGTFVTKVTALTYPEKVPAIIVACPGAQTVPAPIAGLPFVAGNLSLPIPQRLDALQTAFFAPNHDAYIWLDGWYPDTLAMEHAAVEAFGSLIPYWGGGNQTQVLEIIPEDDPFEPEDTWNTTTSLYPDRATSVLIPDVSHALLPEQGQLVLQAVLPWLKAQSSKLG